VKKNSLWKIKGKTMCKGYMLVCPKGTHATSEFIVTKNGFCFVYSLASGRLPKFEFW